MLLFLGARLSGRLLSHTHPLGGLDVEVAVWCNWSQPNMGKLHDKNVQCVRLGFKHSRQMHIVCVSGIPSGALSIQLGTRVWVLRPLDPQNIVPELHSGSSAACSPENLTQRHLMDYTTIYTSAEEKRSLGLPEQGHSVVRLSKTGLISLKSSVIQPTSGGADGEAHSRKLSCESSVTLYVIWLNILK